MNVLGMPWTLEQERDRAQSDKINAEAARAREEAIRANALAFGAACAALYVGFELFLNT